MIDTIVGITRKTLYETPSELLYETGPVHQKIPVVHYDPATGRIAQVAQLGQVEADFLKVPGCAALRMPANPQRDWVNITLAEPAVEPRPTLTGFDRTTIAADGMEKASLNGLPVPCAVTIDGIVHTVTTGELAISAAYLGEYRIEIDHFPYFPFTETVTCT
ncbi:hypothetical protein [Azospirillum doebereinerae]|uniref:Uncharacterized protein n=1 Tax=Azospirillum doebereinerae TaxID=92933 RepID=A0A3S0XJC1_9PROT|nr:hypothetical protein [Azospirillum doebereinerae]RUQ65102.1 hypothetical protein EJ913_25485 [Azospirillum doebereinerae]